MARRARRYEADSKLNVKKIIAVIVFILVVIMFIVGIRFLLTSNTESSTGKVETVTYYTIYDNGQEKWIVYDEAEEKSAVQMNNIEDSLFVIGTNNFFTKDVEFFEKLQEAFNSRITTEEVNGKECYAIKSNNSTKGVIYVSKDNYTPVKIERYSSDGETVESSYTYEVQFDVVTEEDVAIPDLSGYTILDRAKE